MKRSPWSVIVLTLTALILGGRMVWEGLFSRIAGCFLPEAGLFGASRRLLDIIIHHPVSAAIGLTAPSLGWFYLVIGLSWIGALAAVWMRQTWGWTIALVLALLTLLFPGPSNILTALILVLLFLPQTRTWLHVRGE